MPAVNLPEPRVPKPWKRTEPGDPNVKCAGEKGVAECQKRKAIALPSGKWLQSLGIFVVNPG